MASVFRNLHSDVNRSSTCLAPTMFTMLSVWDDLTVFLHPFKPTDMLVARSDDRAVQAY